MAAICLRVMLLAKHVLKQAKKDIKLIMKNLNLAYPKKIDEALPKNRVCGVF